MRPNLVLVPCRCRRCPRCQFATNAKVHKGHKGTSAASRRNISRRALTPTVIGLLESRPWMGHATVVNNGRVHPGSGVAHPACAPGEPQDRGRGAPPRDRPPLRRPPASSSEVPGWVLPSHGRFQGSARVDGRPEVIEEIVWNAISRTMDGMLSLSTMDGSRSLHKWHPAFVPKVPSLHVRLSDPTHMLHYFRVTPLASLKSNASTHDVRRPVSPCVLPVNRTPQHREINPDCSTPSSGLPPHVYRQVAYASLG